MYENWILRAACRYVYAQLRQVVVSRFENGCVVLVVDQGTQGSPKYVVPVASLGLRYRLATWLVKKIVGLVG